MRIEFAVGTSLRAVPTPALVDRVSRFPAPRAGAVVRDPLVAEVRRGHPETAIPGRTVERRFRAATGLTQGTVRQIERARDASLLLAAVDPVARSSPRSDTSTSRI